MTSSDSPCTNSCRILCDQAGEIPHCICAWQRWGSSMHPQLQRSALSRRRSASPWGGS
jgi:hypothetical protein